MKKFAPALLGASFCCLAAIAQFQQMTPVDTATSDAVLAKAATTFPKFHHEFDIIKAQDRLIKQIIFVRQQGMGRGPAFAAPSGVIRIDLGYLETPKPAFDDNRMIVVLYHEIGHLHYYETTPHDAWTPENSEKAAFEYSLKMTKEIAEKGDCGPLATGLRFMLQRSKGTELADPHVRALKRMVNEPLYADYVAYAAKKCPAKPSPTPPAVP